MRGRTPSVAVVLRPGVRRAPIPTKRHALSGRCGGGWPCQRRAHSQKQRGHHGETNNKLHFVPPRLDPGHHYITKAAEGGASPLLLRDGFRGPFRARTRIHS
jgi:hypothetical protein